MNSRAPAIGGSADKGLLELATWFVSSTLNFYQIISKLDHPLLQILVPNKGQQQVTSGSLVLIQMLDYLLKFDQLGFYCPNKYIFFP